MGRAGSGGDAELGAAVRRAQDGDEQAFAVAYRLVHPGLLTYVRGLVGDEAEDVAAEAWLVITRDLGRFKGDGAGFRAWTAVIARHRALDLVRRRKVRPQHVAYEPDLLEVPSAHDTSAAALETLSTERALALIAELPREQGEAVLLRVVVGLDAPSVARVLGKRPGAVRTATYRGLKRLAARIAEADAAGDAAAGTASDAGAETAADGRTVHVPECP